MCVIVFEILWMDGLLIILFKLKGFTADKARVLAMNFIGLGKAQGNVGEFPAYLLPIGKSKKSNNNEIKRVTPQTLNSKQLLQVEKIKCKIKQNVIYTNMKIKGFNYILTHVRHEAPHFARQFKLQNGSSEHTFLLCLILLHSQHPRGLLVILLH